jgi:hypothetical protein
VAADQFRAANEKEYAGERELRAFERNQLTSPPSGRRRFELILAASELCAGKTFPEGIQSADDEREKKRV